MLGAWPNGFWECPGGGSAKPNPFDVTSGLSRVTDLDSHFRENDDTKPRWC
jgi:hypothetical protein